MKKILILSALAATMGIISSCSEDDELTSNSGIDSNTIAFATHSAGSKTRSAVTITSIDKFNVCAVTDDNSPYFTGVDYTFDSSLGVFKSSVPHYWPTTGTVSFYAISDPGTYSADADNVPSYSYENWAAEKDLVAATVIAGEKTIPYPLTFRHVTSQVKISAEAENKTEELTYKLVSVKMMTPSTGTYSFAEKTGDAGSWEIDNTKTSEYSYAEALPVSFTQTGSANPTGCYWNILPVTDGKVVFDIEYQVLQNGKIIADCTGSAGKQVTVANPDLTMGKIYTYNFILPVSTSDEITFTLTLADWEDGGTTDESLSFIESVKEHPELTWVLYNDNSIESFDITSTAASSNSNPSATITNLADAKEVVIGTKVTKLGSRTFANCHAKKVTVPSTVTSWESAFRSSYAETIVLEEGITAIPDYAFAYAYGLKSVVLPQSLKAIGSCAFDGCTALEKVTLPSSLESIGAFAFGGCKTLREVVIPASVTKLGRNPFQQNPELESLKVEEGNKTYKSVDNNCIVSGTKLISALSTAFIPDNITSIEYAAFFGMDVENVTVPSSVISIDEMAFANCKKLKKVTLNEGLTTLGGYAFQSCSGLQEINFPSTLTAIPIGLLSYCTSLESVEIPSTITSIGQSAFSMSDGIKNVIIRGDCSLGANAFKQNVETSSLESVEIDGKVTFDGYAVFWGCVNLSTIKYNSLEAPEFGTGVTSTSNAWSSTSASNSVGYATKSAGKNIFYVPSAATYSETDIDKSKAVLFDSDLSGFTLSKTL